jgi:flagellar hook-associated protein 2
MGITASGLISGLKTDEIIAQLMDLERRPIQLLEQKQTKFETRLSSFLDVNIKLSSLKEAATALNDAQNFNTKTISVSKNASGETLATATASSTAATGNHTIQVSQLAQAHSLAAQGVADQDTTPVLDTVGFPSGGNFSFKVGAAGAVTNIAVTATTTLGQLRDAINNANAGVTATILNDGTATNPYRLVLTSSTTGSDRQIQITNNVTRLDFANRRIEGAVAAATNSGSYTGTVTSSGTYTGTSNKTFLLEIITGGTVGNARYKFSTDGGLTFNDNGGAGFALPTTPAAIGNNTEGVNIAFTDNGSSLSVGDRFTVDVFHPTLQKAQDAIVKVDNLTLVKPTNTIADAIQGVTLNLVKADASTPVNLSISTDATGAQKKIKDFVTAYNAVITFFNKQQSFDPKVGKANPLLGDFTISSVQHALQNTITGAVPGLTSGKLNLAQIGISSDRTTGELSIDDAKLSSMLSSDPTEVLKLFVGTGTPTHNAITLVSQTDKTHVGTYAINITTAPQHASFTSATQLQAAGLGAAELLTFSFTANATSSAPTTSSLSVNLAQNDTINTVVNKLNSAFATNNVALEASQTNGQLVIQSKAYGADIRFTVASDRAADTTSTGIGTTAHTLTGVNVAGSINNHTATGKGNTLTALAGTPEAGLVLSTTATTTGSFGTITVSSGVADRLKRTLTDLLDPTTGILKSRQDALQKNIDKLAEQIEGKEKDLGTKEERLRARFSSLEVLLGKFQSQSAFLTNQLGQLQNIRPR